MERRLANTVLIAFLLWTFMFSPWTSANVNFWGCMTASAVLLSGMAFWFTHRDGETHPLMDFFKNPPLRGGLVGSLLINIALGIGIAVVLWGVFWVGDKLSQLLFPSFARMQVDSIYGMKDGANGNIIAWLLLCLIGPGEEIVWRGYVQRTFETYFKDGLRIGNLVLQPRLAAFVVATFIYAGIHIASCNFMLIMAALVCGIIWGGLYYFFPKYFPAILLSHALWDAAVFIWFPI